MKKLSAKCHIAIGHALLVVSVLLAAIALGLIPDRLSAVREGRAALAESFAASASALMARNDIESLQSMLRFLIERNDDLVSGAVRRKHGDAVVTIGDHEGHWRDIPGEYSLDSQLSVPIWANGETWGYVEIRCKPLSGAGWLSYLSSPLVKLAAFLAIFCFLAFYFQLGRALRDLNPNRAIPAHVRTALDTLAEGLIVADLEGHIVLANRAFADLMGVEPDDLMGRPSSDLGWSTPDGRLLDQGELPWVRTLSDGTPQRDDVICLRSDASMFYSLHVNSSPVLASGGRHRGVLISFDDVTALEAHKAALVQSMEAAESANRAKSEFLANMSHEIRTPMNAILGFTEVLRRGYTKSETEWKKHLNTIYSSGRHLLELINDVLDLSKIEAGRLDVERIECTPHLLIGEVIRTLSVKADEKGVGLDFTVSGQVPETVLSDTTRLRQIVTNLIGNAIKFTEQGRIQVVARLMSHGGRSMYAIDVIDSGIGMPEDKLDAIFEPFVQADSSVTRQFGGTGLGLAISRKFARAMGGDIVVRSETGTGSAFSVTVDPGPLDSVRMIDAAAALAGEDDEIAAAEGSWRFEPGRVLVVDDGEENRELLQLVLGVAGLEVEEAENGQIGVDRVLAEAFDVVLMDMQMPVMDGATATALLRARGVRTPVIALTGNAMKGSETECVKAGCDDYLTKPIDVDRLMHALSRYLPARRIVAETTEKRSLVPESGSRPLSEPGDAGATRASAQVRGCSPDAQKQFVRILDRKLRALEAAHAERDLAALEELASWLKGAAATMGVDGLTTPAERIDACCHPDSAIDGAIETLRGVAHAISGAPGSNAVESPRPVSWSAAATPRVNANASAPSTSSIEDDPRYFEIQAKFARKLVKRLVDIDHAWAERDLEELSRLAHSLKGSSGTVGFSQYVEPARRLEAASRDGDSTGAESAIEEIRVLVRSDTKGLADAVASTDRDATTVPVPAVEGLIPRAGGAPSARMVAPQSGSSPVRDRFAEQLQERIDAADVACQSGDLEAAARLARWLEASAATVQLGELIQPARTLEALAQSKETGQLQAALDDLREQVLGLSGPGRLASVARR